MRQSPFAKAAAYVNEVPPFDNDPSIRWQHSVSFGTYPTAFARRVLGVIVVAWRPTGTREKPRHIVLEVCLLEAMFNNREAIVER